MMSKLIEENRQLNAQLYKNNEEIKNLRLQLSQTNSKIDSFVTKKQLRHVIETAELSLTN